MYAFLSLLGGLLFTLAFAPFDWWWAGVVSLTLIAWIWLTAPFDRAARYGFLFGLGNFGSGVYWVYISLHAYGNASLAFALTANVLLVFYLALYPCLVGFLLRRLSQPRSCFRALLIPLLWSGGEFLRSYVLTGFPWLSAGYSQLDGFLQGLAPIVGMWGVGLALLMICSLLAFSACRRSLYPLPAAFFITLLALGLQKLQFTRPSGDALSVALIQGNVAQLTKFDPVHMEADLHDYIRLSRERGESVIIWPETAVAFLEEHVSESVLTPLHHEFAARGQTIVTGIPSADSQGNYYNAVITLGDGSGRYAKDHLLPFGEFIPWRSALSIFDRFVDIPFSDFSRGGKNQPPLLTAGTPAGVSICFEGAFGRVVRRTLPTAQYLINVSNDGWFLDSIAADQHLQMNRMRALELGREMARATNTGLTAFIDHKGRIKKDLPALEQATLSGWIQPRTGLTPYARFGNLPFIGIWLLYAMIIGLIYLTRKPHARTVSGGTH